MSSRKNGSPVSSDKWELRLYTAGQTPKSLAAIKNLRKVCEEHLAGRYEIEVNGKRYAAKASLTPFYDPDNRRIRS